MLALSSVGLSSVGLSGVGLSSVGLISAGLSSVGRLHKKKGRLGALQRGALTQGWRRRVRRPRAQGADPFLATFRPMPTANAEGWIESEGGVGKVSVRRVSSCLQVDAGPRRSPSACSETVEKKTPIEPDPPRWPPACLEILPKKKGNAYEWTMCVDVRHRHVCRQADAVAMSDQLSKIDGSLRTKVTNGP